MNRALILRFTLVFLIFVGCNTIPVSPIFAQKTAITTPDVDNTVVVTIFTSSDCPFCENVKELVADLKTGLPIKVEMFDINRPNDYDLYCKIQETHKGERFAVPLVIVGDTVLMGQSQIFNKLEDTIRKTDIERTNKAHSSPIQGKIARGVARPGHESVQRNTEKKSHRMKIVNDESKADPGHPN